MLRKANDRKVKSQFVQEVIAKQQSRVTPSVTRSFSSSLSLLSLQPPMTKPSASTFTSLLFLTYSIPSCTPTAPDSKSLPSSHCHSFFLSFQHCRAITAFTIWVITLPWGIPLLSSFWLGVLGRDKYPKRELRQFSIIDH